MSSRQVLDEAIVHAGSVSPNDSSKWRRLELAFESEFDVPAEVKGTLLTDEKQFRTRMGELANADPRYVVLCIVANGRHVVRKDRVCAWLAKPKLPHARCALIVEFDMVTAGITPLELQVYEADGVTDELARLYELPPVPVRRPESTENPSLTGVSSVAGNAETDDFAALEAAWSAMNIVADEKEWDELRDEAVPAYRQANDDFLTGGSVEAFRMRIDSLSKAKNYWGFRGTGQMFFNQLVKAADPVELEELLREALPPPRSLSEAESRLADFLVGVDRVRERARATGATPPGRGRINFFVSFFWGLADRETWPIFYPNSRDVLERLSLLDTKLPQPALYLAYEKVIQELKRRLHTTTWGIEHLLWRLGKGARERESISVESGDGEEDPASRFDLYASYHERGLYFPDEVVTSLVLSLATKRFVILGGISGTGKTQIALGLARHLESVEEDAGSPRHAIVAVRSDWTDPRGLIGFFNPLTNSYSRTAVVDLLLRAAEDPGRPYLVVLDEMNLARVEYYFSDFLSALESGDSIELMSPGIERELLGRGSEDVPAKLEITSNVSFVGTVNIDESTHAFSPKVLDRANVIEFSDVDIERALGHPVAEASQGLRLKEGRIRDSWLCTTRKQSLEPGVAAQEVESFTEALEDVHDLLTRFDRQFGYRVIGEVSAFVGHALDKVAGDPDEIVARSFDLQLRQKVIPKLSGGRELEELLAHLLAYCITGAKTMVTDVDLVIAEAKILLDPSTGASSEARPRYEASARKLVRMLDRLADTGFVGALE